MVVGDSCESEMPCKHDSGTAHSYHDFARLDLEDSFMKSNFFIFVCVCVCVCVLDISQILISNRVS